MCGGDRASERACVRACIDLLRLLEEGMDRLTHDLSPRPPQEFFGMAAAREDRVGGRVYGQEGAKGLHVAALVDAARVLLDVLVAHAVLKGRHRVAHIIVAARAVFGLARRHLRKAAPHPSAKGPENGCGRAPAGLT